MDIVEITPDILDIGDIDTPEFKLNNDSDNDGDIEEIITQKPSVNFGSGIELLMNDKNKNEKKSSSNIDIDDITKLENDLNDLTQDSNFNNFTEKEEKEEKDVKEINQNNSSNKKTIFGGLFGENNKKNGENIKVVNENNNQENLGKSTSKINENKTWDGFGKFNNVPVNLDKTQEKPELTKEEELKEKFKYLRKLEELEKKGVSLTKRYNMDSDLQEMMGEYEMIIAEKEKSNSIKFQGKMMMACITGLEFLNNKFDPFDVKLDGWGEQINENIDEYDEIFAELHEKYKSKAKMSPELKLLFQLGGSAMMVHMSNTLFKSSMPGMDDIMKQNPELMKQFTQAAVNTMGETNPGFEGFMNGIFNNSNSRMNGEGSGANPGFGGFNKFGSVQSEREIPGNSNIGPPPPPVETKLPERSQRVQNIPNRPDLMSAKGVSLDNFGDSNNEERITRPEMKGPSNSSKQSEINSLLSGLKTKQINIPESKNNNENSTISVEDLKELTSAKIPSKSKRKQRSDKNVVSLDI